MPTAGRMMRRLDGRVYRNADGHVMRWKSAYPMNVKVYFGDDGDEQLKIDYHSTYFDPPDYSAVVSSGDTLPLTSTFVPNYGYYYTSATTAYKRATSTNVTVVTGARWEAHWRIYIDAFNFDVVAVYWSTVGVWGPYQTDVNLFLTDMNYNISGGARVRTGSSVPSVMYLRPT